MRPLLTPALLLPACLLGLCGPISAQQRGGFVMLRGTDTLSLERFARPTDRLTGEIETRVAGRTSRVTYIILRRPDGRALRLEYSLTVPQQGLSTAALDISGDSAIGPVMHAERESVFRGAFRPHAVPFLTPLSFAMVEDLIQAGSSSPTFLWGNQRTPVAPVISRVDATHFTLAGPINLTLTVDGQGKIVSGRSTGGDTLLIRTGELLPPVQLGAAPRATGTALAPPMGWNSWNKFGCRIDEALIRETADAMVATGMLAAGYRFLNIDDCWEARTRDADGNLMADSVRFPSGIPALVDYIHAKGLKVGIYSSGGTATCQGRPATLDHEVQDAALFARWQIDYVKYDNCNARNRPEQVRFRAMLDAVKATGRATVFSVCEWGEARPWLWARQLGGQLWRTTEDIRDSWLSMIGILDQQVGLDRYAGPNGWNDPDMLEVGNGKMTHAEYVAHFSLWALLNAPLIAGNDLRAMDDSTRSILLNADVIAVDQDWGGRQGYRLRDDGATEVWLKPMSDGGRALVLLNRGTTDAPIAVTFAEIGLGAHQTVRDLWSGQVVEETRALRRVVPAHGAVMLRVR